MRKDKLEFTLDVVSGIDEEIVDRHLTKRYKLSQRKGKRINVSLLSAIAAVLCLAILGGAVCMIVFGKQVPVYQGMTVSNQAPAVPDSALALPEPMISLLSTSEALPAYGLEPLAEQETIETEAATEGETAPIIFGKTYYALKNEDIYIHIHISNPDGFEIVSFTLNGVKYTNYMFEPGSDLETLILKYNVGDVDGLQEYTIDAIKYIDGEAIKDVRMKGDKTVKVYVNDDSQALRFVAESEFTTLRFTPVWKDDFTGEKVIQSLALYEGESLIRELPTETRELKDLPAGKRWVLAATYFEDGMEKTLRYVFDTPAYSQGLVIENGVIMGIGRCNDSVLYLNHPIGDSAFANHAGITAVYLGPGATYVGERAFDHCVNLKTFVCSENTTRLGKYLFQYCEKLVDIKFSSNLEEIPQDAFYMCNSLESVVIPDGVPKIGPGAFSFCYALKNVSIAQSVKVIEPSAFARCKSLESFVFPDDVTYIGPSFFDECNKLQTITFPKNLEKIDEGAFFGCSKIRTLIYPGTMEEWESVDRHPSTGLKSVVKVKCSDGECYV